MKKNNILLTIVSLAGLFSMQSNISAELGFELVNKSTKSIKVTLIDEKGPEEQNLESYNVAAKDLLVLPISIDDRVIISIDDRSILRSRSYIIDAPGKTKYLTWDPSKVNPLYPQTGTYMGLSGVSESGLSLKNNISNDQLKSIIRSIR